jgi:NADP-dependent 3-hydroxy acid dehydrogenase YdfG
MWQINVHALGLCSQQALKLFPPSGGHILNISSLSGHRVPPTGGFYAATKFAVRAMTEALRSELKLVNSATRISSISPGFVDTPLLDHYFAGREDQLAQTRAEVNMLTPQNIAATALHILSAPPGVEINDVLLRSSDQAV